VSNPEILHNAATFIDIYNIKKKSKDLLFSTIIPMGKNNYLILILELNM